MSKEGINELKELERLMNLYFLKFDIRSEKTELERLALKIVANGMQTIGAILDELEKENNNKNDCENLEEKIISQTNQIINL